MMKTSKMNIFATVFVFYSFFLLTSSMKLSHDDHPQLNKRGGLESTNNAIDRAQAKAQRAHDKVSGVKHVLGNHLGMKDLRSDLKAAWHPEGAGNHQKRDFNINHGQFRLKKRGINEHIDRAQAKVTGIHDRGHAVTGVVKNHVNNNALVQDLKSAWRSGGRNQKRSVTIFPRGLNQKIDVAQENVTGFSNKVNDVKEVVKDHAKNNAFVQDLHNAWNSGR